MTRWGVGPKFTTLSIIYGLIMIALSLRFSPVFKIPFISHQLLTIIGCILIAIGIPFVITAVVTVMRAFNAGQLVTTGIFGMCRHPVYSGWVVFIVPGLVLIVNSWIALTIPLVMYCFLSVLVKDEELYLEKTFGDEYLAYKNRVPLALPLGWIRPKQ